MKCCKCLALMLLTALATFSSAQENQRPRVHPAIKTLVDGNNQFALDLYQCRAVQSKTDDNIFFSPYSISSALAMTYGGARGETAEQLAKVAHFTLGQDRLHPAFGALTAHLQGDGKERPFHLYVANRLWGQKGFPFQSKFIELTQKSYRAGFQEIDFVNDADGARKQINRWVEEQTKDKIKELFRSGEVTSATRLALVNAIYFKGTWETPFPKESTKEADFAVTPNDKVKVAMMAHKDEHFNFHAAGDFDCLELPYKGIKLSMVVVLPKKKGGLAELEKKLTAAALAKALANLQLHKGSVALPRFRMVTHFSLVDDLTALGMPLAFGGSADFSGISDKRVHVGAAVHEAFIDVDEKGTEAAAATGLLMLVGRAPTFAFRADHPFLFLIRDIESGSVLFLGRVSDPSKQ